MSADPQRLYEVIQNEFLTDDANPEEVGQILIGYWERLSEQEKAVMDNVFMYLTGWQFTTLLQKAK